MGYEVGPDLASSPSRNPEALLTNILDPNRTVDPAFLQYLIIDKSGRTFAGKIVAETATSVTLTSGKGVLDTVLRTNIDEVVSTGKSLMPEGFEKTISKEEMADLITFLNGLESVPGTKPTALIGGTHPGTIEP
jgi:putative heme-binding domain-containing protein